MDLLAIKTSIETFIDQKEFDQALNELKILHELNATLEKGVPAIDPKLLSEVIELLFLKSTIFEQKGTILEAINVTDQIQELTKTLDDIGHIIRYQAKVMKAYYLSLIVKIKESQIEIEEIKNLVKNFSESDLHEVKIHQGILFLAKGWIYAFSGKADQGLKLLLASLSILEESFGHSRYVGLCLTYIGVVYQDIGNFKQALDYHQRALRFNKENGHIVNYIWSLGGIASMYYQSGNMSLAGNYFEKEMELAKTQDNLWVKGWAHLQYAIINIIQSNFKIGKKHLLIAREIMESFHAEEWQGYVFWQLAEIAKFEGDLDQAVNYLLKALKIDEAINFEAKIAFDLNTLGETYYAKGELEKSQSYYEQSLRIREKMKIDAHTARTVINLVQLNVELKKFEEAKRYLNKIDQLSKQTNVETIEHRLLMGKALILKESERLFEKGQSQQIFQELANNESIEGSLKMQALFNLCELHLYELKAGGSEKIITEIYSIIDQLSAITSAQSYNVVLVEISLFKAKIKLIEGDIKSANDLLNQALQKAMQHNLIIFMKRIAGEQENLQRQLIQWKDLISRNADYAERIEMAQLNDYLTYAKKLISLNQ